MILSDRDIHQALNRDKLRFGQHGAGKQPLVIDPLKDEQIQPASIDLTLDREFHIDAEWNRRKKMEPFESNIVHNHSFTWPLDLDDIKGSLEKFKTDIIYDAYTIPPGGFCLASTVERVEIPDDLCARVEGKSSLGRLGLLVHLTAGYIDPGFKGKITLEIVNLNSRPIVLRPGRSVCQLSILTLSSPAQHPYGSERFKLQVSGSKGCTRQPLRGMTTIAKLVVKWVTLDLVYRVFVRDWIRRKLGWPWR